MHTHTQDRYVAVDPETGHVHGRSPVRAHTHPHVHPHTDAAAMKASADGAAPPVTATHLARMLQFGDSMFPIGGFSFSGGLESAIQKRVVTDTGYAARVHADRGRAGRPRRRHRARLGAPCRARGRRRRTGPDRRPLFAQEALERDADDVGADGQEVRRAGRAGDRLARDCTDWRDRVLAGATPGCYPVALAVNFAAQGLTARDAFVVHQYGVAATILGAALRLMRISHVDTQQMLYELNADVDAAYATAAAASPRRHGRLRAARGDPRGRPRQGARAPVHELISDPE